MVLNYHVKDGMVKRLMENGKDFVAEAVSEQLCKVMIEHAVEVEPSGRSDYPVKVYTQSGRVFYIDAEITGTEESDERED
jgi:hypothetical protein